MAIATKPKPTAQHHKKRIAGHHRHTKHYVKSYWPYLPMLAIAATGFMFSSFFGGPHAVLSWQQDFTQQSLLDATNTDRQTADRQALGLSPALTQAAEAKANDMLQKNYWSHTSPNGTQPWNFIADAGYQYQTAGENLAYGFSSPSAVLNGWMHSPEHRANVLDSSYSQVGFGVVQAAHYLGRGPQIIVVALYGSPSLSSQPKDFTTPQTIATTPVSRVNSLAASTTAGFLVGVVGALAMVIVLVRHSIAWRKLVNRGELLVIAHPVLDISLVGIATMAVLLSQTAGFIR